MSSKEFGSDVRLFFDYAPQTAARILPVRMFETAAGALLPESLKAAEPLLYGFIGCSCLEGFMSRLRVDASGGIKQTFL